MFGYFRLDDNCPASIRMLYKKYYCFLCRSLAKYYGQVTRFTLSYDVTLLSLFALENSLLENIDKIHCFINTKALKLALDSEQSLKIASLSIMLVGVKVEDDVADERKTKHKITSWIFKNSVDKAKRTYPSAWKILDDGYRRLRILEKNNASLQEIEQIFADMMVNVMVELFLIKDNRIKNTVSAISKWLYFIDALDDLNEDVKKERFNPFYEYKTIENLKSSNYTFLMNHIQELFNGVSPCKPDSKIEMVINRIVFNGIPEATVDILMRE